MLRHERAAVIVGARSEHLGHGLLRRLSVRVERVAVRIAVRGDVCPQGTPLSSGWEAAWALLLTAIEAPRLAGDLLQQPAVCARVHAVHRVI